ncbi:MAG: amidase [Acidobacteria bacterium]|nr:amidase [Acidobacteriota bacterium]
MNLELTELSITRLAPLLRRRRISPVELAEALLARIERAQPRLNSYITVTADLALDQARRAEREIGRGRYRGPLHGIPIAIKDLIFWKGVRTTAGSRILRDFVPGESAAVVERLWEAGAVLLGKTNLHEFAYGPTNLNPHFGPTRNPWDPERMTGGSSGGSAAAVAGAQAVAALGTDTGGSIRIPSSACGCVGLKPTYGRIPLHGVIPLSPSLDHVGPIARCVEDAAVVLQALVGSDPRDPFSSGRRRESFAGDLRKGLGRMRLGLPRKYFFARLQRDVRNCLTAAIRLLEEAGARVEEVDLPFLERTEALSAEIIGAEALLYHWRWLQQRPGDYGPDVRHRLESHTSTSAASYLEARRELAAYAAAFDRALRSVHALVAPTLPVVAPYVDESEVRIGSARWPVRPALLRFTRPANLAGLPAISMPCGFSRENLPVGLQLIGRRRDERTLLRLAWAYESMTPWHSSWPPG